mmetsp:Transcript_58026/g.188874  ORF Transcript_58026/g.188874 Transcript_58026/m.188874 type:complete len:395 (-) Transcript_58026:175-1359(-)
MRSCILLQEVQSNSSKPGIRQQGTRLAPVTLFMPASFTNLRPGAASRSVPRPSSVRCQHHDRSSSAKRGIGPHEARAPAATSENCSHSATLSSRHPTFSSSTLQSAVSSAGDGEDEDAEGQRCSKKKAAQSESVGLEAFRRVKQSSDFSEANSCKAPTSNSRAKDTANRCNLGNVVASRASSSASKSSPSRLNSTSPDHTPARGAAAEGGAGAAAALAAERRSCEASSRKQPSSCSAAHAPRRRVSTEASASHSQKRTSRRTRPGQRSQSTAMCRSSKVVLQAAPSSCSVATRPRLGRAAPVTWQQLPTSSARSGPSAKSSAMPRTTPSSTTSKPFRQSRSTTPRPWRRNNPSSSAALSAAAARRPPPRPTPKSTSRQSAGAAVAAAQLRQSEA